MGCIYEIYAWANWNDQENPRYSYQLIWEGNDYTLALAEIKRVRKQFRCIRLEIRDPEYPEVE